MKIKKKMKSFLGEEKKGLRIYLFFLILVIILMRTNIIIVIFRLSVELGYLSLGFTYLIMHVLIAIFIVSALQFINGKIIKKIFDSNKEYKGDLYTWLGESSVSDNFIQSLFSETADSENNDINNLINIKRILKKKLKGNMTNYYLLKNHLEFKQKNNFAKFKVFILSTIGTVVATIIIPYLKSLIYQGDLFDKNVGMIIFKLFSDIEYFGLLFKFFGIGLVVYMTFLTTYLNVTERSRRNNYLLSIVDVLIKEK